MQEALRGFRLSPQQERLWKLQTEGRIACPWAACLADVDGPLDAALLRCALEAVAARHEILRTAFRRLPGMGLPLQVPAPQPAVELRIENPPEPVQREPESLLRALLPDAPDLETPRLQARLVPLSPVRHALLLAVPALWADRKALFGLLREVERSYGALLQTGPRVAAEPVQYADLSETLWEILDSAAAEAGPALWREWSRKLAATEPLALPFGRDREAGRPFLPRTVGFTLADDLAETAERCGATVPAVVCAAWQTLLGYLSGRAELPLAIACDGRTFEGLEETPGLLARYLPLYCELGETSRFADLVRRAGKDLQELADCQYVAGAPTAEADGPAPTIGFDFVELPPARASDPAEAVPAVSFSPRLVRVHLEALALELACTWRSPALVCELHYDPAVLADPQVARIARWLESLLRSAAAAPEAALEDLQILSAAERSRLLAELNDTRRLLSQERPTLHGLVAAQAARTPDRVAAVCGDEHLTYRSLVRRARALAGCLRGLGAGPEVRVGICAEPSLARIVGQLAVLEAGAAYLPLEPAHPRQRRTLLVEDAQPVAVLAGEPWRAEMGRLGVACLGLETGQTPAVDLPRVAPENLAYAIYTSGSAGRPKGVLVSHGAIVNRLLWMRDAFPLTADDRVLHKTPFGFDASIWEIFLPLLAGARLSVLDARAHRDSSYLTRAIREQEATVLQLVPSLLAVWLDEPDLGACASLRAVFCGGEALPAAAVARLRRILDRVTVVNLYGPTECAIDAACRPCRGNADDGGPIVPVGRPIANTRIYLLDRRMRPVPEGVPGELCVGGAGLARGYLGRADLTAERFVPDPFSRWGGEPGGRLYRTGDLARHRPNGELEFLGRLDQQVKLRGVRIEPREIEASLESDPAVRQAVVVARPGAGGDPVLAAYVVPRGPRVEGWAATLRADLARRLPESMVPASVVVLDELPRLPSGKVDRRRLPDPAETAGPTGPVAPRSLAATVLADLWAELLGRASVGVDDDFFDLGGHSLLATQLTSRVRRVFGVELSMRAVFDLPMVAALARHVEALQRHEAGFPAPPLVPVERGEEIPLSFAQQRLWFLSQLDVGSAAYNIAITTYLIGPLDRAALERSFGEVVRRHEPLRTTFPDRDGRPCQRISPPAPVALPQVDLSQLAPAARETRAAALARREARRPFDLERGPLLRLLLVRLEAERHLLVLVMHHIVSDGWSTAILLREIGLLYEAFHAGRPSPLPELPVQYADFACWQRHWLQGERLESQLAWWRERLAGALPLLELPADRPRPAVPTFRGARLPMALGAALTDRLRAAGRRQGATLFILLLAAFKAFLHHATGATDLLVGTPIANRIRIELEGLIGFFVNTLALRSTVRRDESFADLLARVREVSLAAAARQELPFEKLVEELRPERDFTRTPMVNVFFVFQSVPPYPSRFPELELEIRPIDNGTAKFDLTVDLAEAAAGVAGAVEFSTDLFDATTVVRLVGHLENLLAAVAADPSRKLSDLPLLSAAERQQLLREWNDSAATLPGGGLHDLVAARAAEMPDAVAVRSERGWLSYGELARRAVRLARRLCALGVGPDVRVGLLAARSAELLAGFLGILEAGGAFLPLDPQLPPERLDFMLADSGARVLLAGRQLLAAGAAALHPRTVCLEDALDRAAGEESGSLPGAVEPDRLAYVMYTSGSSGRPKGVMVPHRGLVNYLLWAVEAYGLQEGETAPVHSPVGFDLTLTSLFAPLLAGGSVALLPDGVEAPDLALALQGGGFGLLKVTPAHLDLLRDGMPESAVARLARVLVVGGEALYGEAIDSWRACAPDLRIVNEYGPTETVVGCCAWEIPAGETAAGPVPIGRPIGNTRLHLLGPDGVPVPLGAIGELYVGGAGVARGYLGRPARTAERFVPDPFAVRSEDAGGRLYRTGDVARRLSGGALVFLGRADGQVKVRGVRIEPGEIEAALLRHPAIREAAVADEGDSLASRRLVAYFVAAEPPPGAAELRSFLRQKLPEPMVPSVFVAIAALPLTPNGKVDRKALRGLARPEPERAAVAPRDDVESVLAEIWSEVLGRERIGVQDDFFDLGGHSLLATQILSRIRKVFRTQLALRSFFAAATVEKLAEALVAAESRPGQTRRIARLVLDLGRMDDAEARRLLAQKRRVQEIASG